MYSEEAKNIIDEIYIETTGIGLRGCEDEKTNKAFSKLKRRLQGALEELAIDLNTEETHFVLELIQNAEDNKYDNLSPYLRFTINENSILVQNNEIGFNEEDVRAICGVKESTKLKKYGYIGEKGIGFKSVFKVSDEPHIFSNGFRFKFSCVAKDGDLGFIVPYWIDEIPEIIDNNQTNIFLPIKEEAKERISQFKDIDPTILLFLKKLKRIEIINECENIQNIFTKQEESGCVILSSKHDKSYYKIIRKKFEVPTFVKEEKRKGVEKTEIILAFEVSENGTPITNSELKVFSFLPTQVYGFKFIIQADFLLTANRESITKDVIWNEWIRDKIHEIFLDSVDSFKSDDILKTNYYRYLPLDGEINDYLFAPVVEMIYSSLNDFECILTESGSWAKPPDVIIIEPKLRNLVSNEDVKRISGKEIVSSKIPKGSLPSRLHITTFTKESFFIFLRDIESIKTKSNEWLVSLYEYLIESKEDIISLKKLPIFRLNNGELESTEDMNIFFYLEKSGKNYGFEDDLVNSVGILNYELLELIEKNDSKKEIVNLLSDIGIKRNNPYEIIEKHILPIYKDDTWKKKESNILKGHVRYIKDNISYYKKKNSSITELGNLIFLKIKMKGENTGYYCHPNQIYLSNEYKNKYNLNKLFSGLTEFSDYFLASDYLEDDSREISKEIYNLKSKIADKSKTWKKKNRKEVTKVETKLSELEAKNEKIIAKWRDFFLELGIKESLTIEATYDDFSCKEFNKLFESINKCERTEKKEKIRILFQMFNEEWDNYQKYISNQFRENSSFILQLRKTQWIPATDGSLVKPHELFFDNSSNRELMENQVKFFDSNICTKVKKSFLKDLGIIFEPSISIVLDKLVNCSDTKVKSKNLIKKLYYYLNNNFDTNPYLIKDFFSQYKIIYDPISNNYFTSDQVFWGDHSFIFGSTRAYLVGSYNDLKTFFVNKLEIGEPKPEHYVDRLIQLSKEEIPTNAKSVEKYDKIILKIYEQLSSQMSPDNTEIPLFETDWWKEKRIDYLSVIWTDKNEFFKKDQNIYVNDDDYLHSLFKNKDNIAFLKVPKDFIPKVSNFIKHFNIMPISKAVKSELLNIIGKNENIGLSQLIQNMVKYIERYLYFTDIKVYENLLKNNCFSDIKNLVICEVEGMKVKYCLNGHFAISEGEQILIRGQKLYIQNLQQNKYLLGIKLSEMLGGLKGLDDFIILLLSQSNEEEIEKLMISKKIGEIPSENSDKFLVPPNDFMSESHDISKADNRPREDITNESLSQEREKKITGINSKKSKQEPSSDGETNNVSKVDNILRKDHRLKTNNVSKVDNRPRDENITIESFSQKREKNLTGITDKKSNQEPPSDGDLPFTELDTKRNTNFRETPERSKELSQWVRSLYGYHCQICLAKEDPALLTYPKSYASYDKNRKHLMHAHHIKAVSERGHDHPGNYLSLCKYHHDYIHQIGLTVNELNKALKSVTQKEVTWPDGSKYNWFLLTFDNRYEEDNETLKLVIRTEHLEKFKEYMRSIIN